MVLRYLSTTLRGVLGPHDSPPADSSPPLASQGVPVNGARADVDAKMKDVEHLLAKSEKEGPEIDGKIASIIDEEIAIKAEAARENNNNEPKRKGMVVLLKIASVAVGVAVVAVGVAVGFVIGMELRLANALRNKQVPKILFYALLDHYQREKGKP
ncbi:unnamed protein product [Urochloa decumbens]|uniref:Uncharacterized protein n=1 Tax=Urochloa decumbens TaxID=240449 RepID=A0ABC9FK55_9POAL